ncbi:MAG: hypothetical protein AAGK97_14335 [Bacteroidota bacterium]
MKYILIFILAISLFTSCKSKIETSTNESSSISTSEGSDGLSKGFKAFYKTFLSDSSFQMSSISFPLEGIPNVQEVENAEDFKWEKESWKLHKALNDPHDEFLTEFKSLGDNLVVEVIKHKTYALKMERRFAKTSEGWKLIYYQDFNLYE